jgi:hypothetical protein
MVYFQCELCVGTLKKKQLERHYLFECRSATTFSCLTCFKIFDRATVKDHISCISEQEKYQKGDNLVKKRNGINGNTPKVIQKVNLNELKWSGIRKTSRKILNGEEHHKMPIANFLKGLAQVYANSRNANVEEVDNDLLKNHTMKKLENDDRFVIDLSRNTIRFKS